MTHPRSTPPLATLAVALMLAAGSSPSRPAFDADIYPTAPHPETPPNPRANARKKKRSARTKKRRRQRQERKRHGR